MIISNFIISYFLRCIGDSFQQDDLDKIKYSLQVILWELEKFILMGIIFACLGRFQYFLTTSIVLISIRAFSGGYHAQSNLACFSLSLVMFLIAILFAPMMTLPFVVLLFLAVVSFGINLILAPIPSIQLPKSKIKPELQRKKKVFSTIITGIWLIVILRFYKYPLCLAWLCIIVLQNVQLCIEVVRRYVRGNG